MILARLTNQLPDLPLKTAINLSIIMLICATAAYWLAPPSNVSRALPDLESMVPKSFDGWIDQPSPYAQVSVNNGQELTDVVYDAVLMRTYLDAKGNQIMLALAYAKEQRQDVKIHQPDVCYPAQGYQLLKTQVKDFSLEGYALPIKGKQQIYKKDSRLEAVSYWVRVGDATLTSGLGMRLKIIKDGLQGKLDDGILVRVSNIIGEESEADKAYLMHQQFLSALVSQPSLKTVDVLLPVTIN